MPRSSALWNTRFPVGIHVPPPPPKPKLLPVAIPHQEQSFWCWVAAGSGVANYYDGQVRPQCFVVTLVFETIDPNWPKINCCAVDASQPPCNGESGADQALDHPKHHFAGHALPLDESSAMSQIDQGRPFIAEIAWSGGGTHFIVITGYVFAGDPAIFNVYVQDPFYGPSWCWIQDLFGRYQGTGTWFDTTLSQP